MVEFTHILCPIDFSDYSRHALDHAAAIARWYGSTITLFYAHPVVPIAAAAPGAPAFPPRVVTAADADEVLGCMKRFAEDEAGVDVPIRFETGQGAAVVEILDQAKVLPADLIVMGTHGRSGFERLALGSITEKVLRKASCPVLTVPRRAREAAPVPPFFTRILCAVDFSDCSLKALDYAMSLAQEADATLTVLHVIEAPHAEEDFLVGAAEPVRQYAAAVEEERRARLDRVVPGTVRAYCTVKTVVATGKPYREILRAAAADQSALIVIGIHGRGAVDLLFFGSTTQHVVRDAACPVLTLRR